MTQLVNLLAHGLVRFAFILFLAVSLAACGGSSSDNSGTLPPPPPPPGNIDDDDEEEEDDDDDEEQNADAPKGTVTPQTSLSPKQSVIIVFNESMNPDSVKIEGSLAAAAQHEWSQSDNENDTLTLTPEHYWPAGNRSLRVTAANIDDVNGTAEAEFDVRTAFTDTIGASIVVGQQDFESGESRQGASYAHANTLDEPLGSAAYANEHDILFITDTWDARVLGFNGTPDVNNANASFVLGQPDFNSSGGRVTRDGMVSPQYVSTNQDRLIVTDTEAYRVTIYDHIPQDGSSRPQIVVGQPDFETRVDRPPCNAASLNHSHGHFLSPAGKFLVASSWQNRVLIWNELPTENYQPADRVLGQPNLESCADVPGGPHFRHPTDIWTDDERLLILDSEKNRLLIWNSFPTDNFVEPDVVIGQRDLVNEEPNDDNQDGERDENASARVMDYPRSLWVDEHGQLYIADMNNHRILIWHEIPRESFTPADAVIGQPDFYATGGNDATGVSEDPVSAHSFNSPTGVSVINDKLFVTERFNHRVLIFEAE